jgi:CobQ/CobB/MinD/ParA nucleotide binding domain.
MSSTALVRAGPKSLIVPASSHTSSGSKGKLGRIISFNSYRGGTGRSLAVANIACLLAKSSTNPKVLIIDWDLPAPGLHFTFDKYMSERAHSPGSNARAAEVEGGILEIFTSIYEEVKPSIHPRFDDVDSDVAIEAVKNAHPLASVLKTDIENLDLLKAGRFDSSYSGRLHKVDWNELLHHAPSVFTAFALRLCQAYDYILIDAPSGLGTVAQVCGGMLAERVVLMFNLNMSGLLDTEKFLSAAISRRAHAPDLRLLELWPLPTRLVPELKEKTQALRRAEDGYQKTFEQILARCYGLQNISLEAYFDEMFVDECPEQSYNEDIFALTEFPPMSTSLFRDYMRCAAHLTGTPAPWVVQRTE